MGKRIPKISEFKPRPGQVDLTNARYAPVVNCVVKYRGKILLVKRSRALNFYPALWNGISGFLDDRKGLEEKVFEELEEETGIVKKDIISIKFGSIFHHEDKKKGKVWIVHPVLVEVKTNRVRTDWEAEEYRFVSVAEARRFKLVPGFDKILECLFGQELSAPRVGVGVGICILHKGKVLLGKRHGDSKKADSELHGEGTWTMPGGKVHFRERLEDACRREIFEETGLRVSVRDLKFIHVSNDMVSDAHFVTLGFLCERFEGLPKVKEPDEITQWKWFDLKKLPKPLFFPSAKVLRSFRGGFVYKGEEL